MAAHIDGYIFFPRIEKHIPCNTLTHSTNEDLLSIKRKGDPKSRTLSCTSDTTERQALVSFKTYMPPPLPYFKVNICLFPLPHFASIFFAYLWSFRWPNYIVTLPRYFSFRLPHLNIPTGPPQTNWTRINRERGLVKISVIETIQPLPVCAGFFICIRNSLDHINATMIISSQM